MADNAMPSTAKQKGYHQKFHTELRIAHSDNYTDFLKFSLDSKNFLEKSTERQNIP